MTPIGERQIQNGGSPSLPAQQKTEDIQFRKDTGYFDKALAWLTQPVQTSPDPLEPDRVSLIGDKWSDLIQDVAQYIIVDVANREPNADLILNVSKIIQQVLLAMGTIKSQGQQPHEMDNPEFGKQLIANILKEFVKHDHALASSDPELEQDASILRVELTKIFENLMKQAGLDKEHIKNKPTLIQEALYPSRTTKAFIWVTKSLYDLPSVSREKLEKLFVDKSFKIIKVNRNLKTTDRGILKKHDGLSEFLKNYLGLIVGKLREGKLPIEYPFLRHQKNKDFLTSVINQVLSQDNQTDKNGDVINKTWTIIDKTLKKAIKTVFAVVLETTSSQETPRERLEHIVDGILDRLATCSDQLRRIGKINLMGASELTKELENVPEENQPEGRQLLAHKDMNWESEARALLKEAWDDENVNDNDLENRLKEWEKQQEENAHWKISYSDRAKALLARKGLSWEQRAQHFLKKIEYAEIARIALEKELKPEKFSQIFTKFIPAETLFTFIYQHLGEIFLEFNEHLRHLQQRGEAARRYIKDSKMKALASLIDDLLPKLVKTIEDKAVKKNFDFGYPFLNDMVCHLLRSPTAGEEHTGRTTFKDQIQLLFKNILMIVITETIKRNISDTVPAEQAFSDLINTLLVDVQKQANEIREKCQEIAGGDETQQRKAIDELVSKHGMSDFTSLDPKKGLVDHYRELRFKLMTRALLEKLLPQDLFNSLLPPILQNRKLWEMMADDVFTPNLSSIFKTVEAFGPALPASEVGGSKPDDDILDPDKQPTGVSLSPTLALAPEIQKYISPFIEDIEKRFNAYLDNVKLNDILGQSPEGNTIDMSVLDQVFGVHWDKAEKSVA